jgi:hypothetical protein
MYTTGGQGDSLLWIGIGGGVLVLLILIIIIVIVVRKKKQTTTPAPAKTSTASAPAPAPVSTSWKGPYNNIWNDSICSNVGNHLGTALDACKSLCNNTTGCNAINYDPTRPDCVLRRCSGNAMPNWNYPPYKGYTNQTIAPP